MQRQTPSCVDNIDIDGTMPMDSSTAGLFLGGFGVACSNAKTNPSCVGNIDMHEAMPVDSSTTGLFLGGLELHVPMQRQTPIMR